MRFLRALWVNLVLAVGSAPQDGDSYEQYERKKRQLAMPFLLRDRPLVGIFDSARRWWTYRKTGESGYDWSQNRHTADHLRRQMEAAFEAHGITDSDIR